MTVIIFGNCHTHQKLYLHVRIKKKNGHYFSWKMYLCFKLVVYNHKLQETVLVFMVCCHYFSGFLGFFLGVFVVLAKFPVIKSLYSIKLIELCEQKCCSKEVRQGEKDEQTIVKKKVIQTYLEEKMKTNGKITAQTSITVNRSSVFFVFDLLYTSSTFSQPCSQISALTLVGAML